MLRLALTTLLLTVLATVPAFAQTEGGPYFLTGTSGSASCSPMINVSERGSAAVQIDVTGTYTVQFQGSISGGAFAVITATDASDTTPAPESTTTADGVFFVNVGGLKAIRVCGTAGAGSASAWIGSSPSGGGSSGGSATISGEGLSITAEAQPATDPHFVACAAGGVAGACEVSGTVTANLSATDNAVLDDIADGIAVTGTVTATLSATDNAVLDDIADGIAVTGTVTANLGATDTAALADIADGIAVTNAGTFAVQCSSGCSAGTSDDDDGSIAGAQTVNLAAALTYVWNGSAWVRATGSDATHDEAALTTGPQILGYGSATAPAAASAGGDAVRVWVDLNGRLQVGDGGAALTVDNGGTFAVQSGAATAGGCTPHSIISAASVNETQIKSTAGQVYAFVVMNTNAAARYLKVYNDTAANVDETDTPVFRFIIPANSTTGGGFVVPFPVGAAFSTAITYRVTTGAADSDTGAVGANEIMVNACYL